MDTHDKGETFRALHERDRAFVIPNPWDVGTAKLLANAGFEALATTSAGYAFSTGRPDGAVARAEMIVHVQTIVSATHLPVSADLENGFGDSPEDTAETIRQGAATGLAGGSIEDSTGRADAPIYERELAVERVRAAVEAASAAGHLFTLTARCENYLHGRPDLADTIGRLQAYQDAGAHVLYAPGVSAEAEISSLVSALDRPVNVLVRGPGLSLDALSKLGVKRISVGGGLYRVAMAGFLRAAREMREQGSFEGLLDGVEHSELMTVFEARL